MLLYAIVRLTPQDRALNLLVLIGLFCFLARGPILILGWLRGPQRHPIFREGPNCVELGLGSGLLGFSTIKRSALRFFRRLEFVLLLRAW